MKLRNQTLLLILCTFSLLAETPEELADLVKRQCRSIHLGFESGPADGFYNEVRVTQSSVGTYYCVAGFSSGYFGLQEREGDKVIIFSVWDPGQQNDPNSVAAEQRVKLMYKDPEVKTGRFGNEGTGGQSFFEYAWKTNETYRFAVSAKVDAKRTTFGAYFFINETQKWKHLVSFQTETGGKKLEGMYAFIEDFKRDYISATKARSADFGPAYVLGEGVGWQGLMRAGFTGDVTPSTNIDAGVKDQGFRLITGGSTTNHTKLSTVLETVKPEKLKWSPPF